jgi:endonuclease/exonuclease/phosphatase family metal-dependent hydrolase
MNQPNPKNYPAFSSKQKQFLKILSFNTHLFEGLSALEFLKPSLFWKEDERKHAIAEYIKNCDADVVCLCEVWGRNFKGDFMNNTDFLVNLYPYSYDRRVLGAMGNGLLILSKYPINNVGFERYSDRSGWDAHAQKGFLYGTVVVSSTRQFRIFFTHTQASECKHVERAKQIQRLYQFVEEDYIPFMPAVILGDFNIVKSSAEYDTMMNQFSDKFADAMPHDCKDLTFEPAQNALAMRWEDCGEVGVLDYIFYSRNSFTVEDFKVLKDIKYSYKEGSVTTTEDCSDHYAVCATLRFSDDYNCGTSIIDIGTAKKFAQYFKSEYGDGASCPLVVTNNTDDTWYLTSCKSLANKGWFQYNTPSPVIFPGGSVASFHVHSTGECSGSYGSMTYSNGQTVITMIFGNPWILSRKMTIIAGQLPLDVDDDFSGDDHCREIIGSFVVEAKVCKMVEDGEKGMIFTIKTK